jgi:hypothetical protein
MYLTSLKSVEEGEVDEVDCRIVVIPLYVCLEI